MINLQVTVNDETYKITELIADFVEAQHDMRLMSEELERNERTIDELRKENASLRIINQNLEFEKSDALLESFATQDYIEELHEEIEELRNIINQIKSLTQ
jgi:hypothetical protein